MALTPDLSTITLTGTYVDLNGLPISGLVAFSPQSILKDTDQNQIIINSTIIAPLDGNGSFSVVLPVTDDSDVAPIPFAYAVEEIFAGGRSFFITIPAGGTSSQDIADFAPAVSNTEAANFVTQSQFNTLFSRHVAALTNYNQIIDIAANVTAADNFAIAASQASTGASKASHQFLLMGL